MATVLGNTMILKPSEKDPGATMLLAKLAQEAGLPDGVLQVRTYSFSPSLFSLIVMWEFSVLLKIMLFDQ